MSLVKFTELPAGSIQGGDVMAFAGASSYKVTAVEYANWSNKRLQGNTDKTVENAFKFAESNSNYIGQVINPQLATLPAMKTDTAAVATNLASTDVSVSALEAKINSLLATQYANEPSIIASMITNDNYVKNPAAQTFVPYWQERIRDLIPHAELQMLGLRDLLYPAWTLKGDLLTNNFTVARNGVITLGQIGGKNPADMEYRVNGGAWEKVGGDGTRNLGVGYAGLHSAGAQISVRMHKDSGGIAFAIPTPAYWLTPAGIRDGGVMITLEKLTYGLRRKRINLVECGYCLSIVENIPTFLNDGRTPGLGLLKNVVSFTHKPTTNSQIHYIIGQTDPDKYNRGEISI